MGSELDIRIIELKNAIELEKKKQELYLNKIEEKKKIGECENCQKLKEHKQKLEEEIKSIEKEVEKERVKHARGAGRKPVLSVEQEDAIYYQKTGGLSVIHLALAYNVSTASIYKAIKNAKNRKLQKSK